VVRPWLFAAGRGDGYRVVASAAARLISMLFLSKLVPLAAWMEKGATEVLSEVFAMCALVGGNSGESGRHPMSGRGLPWLG